AGPAEQGVVPGRADEHVVAVAAVGRQLQRARCQGGRVHRVVPGQAVDRQLVRGLGPGDADAGGQAEHRDAGRVARHDGGVVADGAVDDHGIRRPVAGAGGREADVDVGHVRAGQVVDGDRVGPAQGVDVDYLEAVQVHGDVADVPGEADAAAVGREVHVLAD